MEKQTAIAIATAVDGTPNVRIVNFEQMAKRPFSYANDINGHYKIAMSVPTYAAVDDTFRQVVSKGAVPVLEPTTEPWGQRTCYVVDPNIAGGH